MAMPLMDAPGLITPLAWSGDREELPEGICIDAPGIVLCLTWCGYGPASPPPRRRTADPLAAVRIVPDSSNSLPRVDPLAAESIAPDPVV